MGQCIARRRLRDRIPPRCDPSEDQADTDPLNPKNVAQQRQLNDQGRALAASIGKSLKALRIPVGEVHTSLFQRAVDTGALMDFGAVKASVDYTEGGLVVTPIENNRRAGALRKIAATVPPAGTNVIVVTHKPNILDAFGKDWFDVREGEASIFKPDGNGGYKLITRVQGRRMGGPQIGAMQYSLRANSGRSSLRQLKRM